MANKLYYGDNLDVLRNHIASESVVEREAAAGGIRTDPVTGIDYPKLQLFTLAELFQGRHPKVPLLDRQAGFRKAKREETSGQGMLI